MTSTINHDDIPGDVTLINLIHKRHSGTGKSDIVLVPSPSQDPDDPLNWSANRKRLSLFCNVLYVYAVCVPGAVVYPLLLEISGDTGISLEQLNNGTGYQFLFLGLGAIFFQPLARQYGKRPIYLFSTLSFVLICLWTPFCKTNAQWIGSQALQGLFSSPVASLCEISVADISFQHELSTFMSIYAVALNTSTFLAPMVAGFINERLSWKWVMYLAVIFGMVCFLILFLFMEETNFERHLIDSIEHCETFDGFDPETSLSSPTQSKDGIRNRDIEVEKIFQAHTSAKEISFESADSLPLTSTKTFWEKISISSGCHSKFLLAHFFLGPFKMAQFPVVLWSGFLMGTSLVWFNLLNATEALILSSDPYNFSTSFTGLAYLSPAIFALLFQFLSGPLSDWTMIRLAKRRPDGLSIPEDRLWILVIYMVLGFLGSIGWGVGAYYKVHWSLLVLSMGVLGGCGTFGLVVSSAYSISSYHHMGSEALVVITVIRNCMSFACSYGLTDWVLNMGYKNAFISSACILLLCNGSFLIMRFVGPWTRRTTKHRYWKLLEKDIQLVESN